jgi:hypothetical protein
LFIFDSNKLSLKTKKQMKKTMKMLSLMLAALFVTTLSFGQYSNSAIKQGSEQALKSQDTTKNELQEIVVTAKKVPLMTKVGPYGQPLWTTIRMFPSTRVYVMNPPGTAMYEKWFDIRQRRNGPAQIRMRDEFTFGLGKRLQLDLYSHTVYDGENGDKTFRWRGFSWEFRYALADWGKIWGNPTLYFETKMLDGRWGIEPKLLLGDRIGQRGVWGFNAIYEGNLASTKEEREPEYAYTASYASIINNDLSVGVSHMFRYNDYEGGSQEWYLGPLVQYRFSNKGYLNIEHMPGLNQDAKQSRTLIIFGWRF